MLLFAAFEKIARIHRDVVITEKIDGTNGVIAIADDFDELCVGSRSQWITSEKDNFGFARWVKENEDEVRKLGPGYHYGEWWGGKIQRGYGLSEKRFSLFNVARWGAPETRPACIGVVPTLYTGPLFVTPGFSPTDDEAPMVTSAVAAALGDLRRQGSRAAPGFMKPEGVVIFHTASQSLFKATLEKDEKPKGSLE